MYPRDGKSPIMDNRPRDEPLSGKTTSETTCQAGQNVSPFKIHPTRANPKVDRERNHTPVMIVLSVYNIHHPD